MKRNFCWLTCFLLMFSTLLGRTLVGDELSYYEKTLTEKNIGTDSDGLKEYLRGLHPNEQQRQRAMQLLKALGSTDSFAKREDAMAELIAMPVLPNEELIAASVGSDPEIRWRAEQILKHAKPERERVLFAVFKTIELKKPQGLTRELLRAIPLCDKSHLRLAARKALSASADRADAELLRSELKSENVEIRVAAAEALGQALGKDSSADLNRLHDDQEDQVQLAAARGLANFGDRKSLTALLGLLASEDVAVRAASAAALRELTGKRFGFAPYDASEMRGEKIAAWKAWVDAEGQTAALNFPLKQTGSGSGYLGGNLLLAFGYKNKVAEYDPSGKEIWTFTAQGAWSAEKLASGNVLIAAYNEQRVIEVDLNGKVVWEYPVNQPLNVRPLQNGNILISVHQGQKVIELNRNKEVVWEIATPGLCCDAHRLENGNTIFAAGNSIIEVKPDKTEVWNYPANQVYGIHPRENGNVLICELGGRVIEVDREKNVLWQHQEQNPVDVFPLPNGNFLITGAKRFVEVTPDGKGVWSKDGCSYGTARK